MGIRCTQVFGLNEWAWNFIQANTRTVPSKMCPHCNGVVSTKLDSRVYEDGSHLGMFDDGPPLYEYPLLDGRIAREVVQAIPWSSGPCIFLCLEIDGVKVKESLWKDEEIDNC